MCLFWLIWATKGSLQGYEGSWWLKKRLKITVVRAVSPVALRDPSGWKTPILFVCVFCENYVFLSGLNDNGKNTNSIKLTFNEWQFLLPGSVLGIWDTSVNKMNKVLCPYVLTFSDFIMHPKV